VEQIGSGVIKGLFSLNTREIKTDVIANIKSRDADSLVAAIDTAIDTGSWEGAKEVWEYVKSRRVSIKGNLTDAEASTVQRFILSQRKRNIFILQKGALEAYLPTGYRGKDIDKLIRFVADEGFWSHIPEEPRREIRAIVRGIFKPR
jgi:putative ATP-dependent endonuclease of OLD family